MVQGTLINNHNVSGLYSTFGRKTSESGSLSAESPGV